MSQENRDEEEYELEVLEMESDSGETEEFVVLDRLMIEESEYALMIPLERYLDLSELSPEEYSEIEEDFEGITVMRVEGDKFVELDEEEIEAIQPLIESFLEEEE